MNTILFRVFLALSFMGLLILAIRGVAEMGALAALEVFVEDLTHPWRALFDADLAFHLVLLALWIFRREGGGARGLACVALTLMLGGVFMAFYLLVAAARARGDLAILLLGHPHRAGKAGQTGNRDLAKSNAIC